MKPFLQALLPMSESDCSSAAAAAEIPPSKIQVKHDIHHKQLENLSRHMAQWVLAKTGMIVQVCVWINTLSASGISYNQKREGRSRQACDNQADSDYS
jgi:hypothetical protein